MLSEDQGLEGRITKYSPCRADYVIIHIQISMKLCAPNH